MKLFIYILIFTIFVFSLFIGVEYLYEQKYAKQQETGQEKIKKHTSAKQNTIINDVNTIEKTPPHFLAGFDWSLRANPRQGEYNFSKLEERLKRIAPQRALLRLEVNSSCEAPKWALTKLRQTKHKSLIYWDKSYIDLTRPFIQAFAKRFAAHPQIIGVQLGLADGEFGEATDSCNNYSNKNGWGEFWMSPSERKEAETQFGFNPDVFLKSTLANIDIYAEAFGKYKSKLAFTNIGTLFTYGEGAKPYNQTLKVIAKYALDKGLGNRDGAIERWMSYTDKIYGSVFTSMPDGSCRLDVDETYMRNLQGRYWGTENEFYGNKDYVIADMGPVKNHPYIFLISSLRALQMRRNYMSTTNMLNINHTEYKTQEFLSYLTFTMGKQYEDTPDAFVLMGERYIAPYRLADQMDVDCVRNNPGSVSVRSFGRWLNESPQNTHVENKATMKVHMPASENYWYQGYYLPEGIDYEYSARQAKNFGFDVNDQLSDNRCKNGCEVEIKATFKDTTKTKLHIEVAEGVSMPIETFGDNKIKTVTFKIKSKFNNQLQGLFKGSDLSLNSENHPISLILMRINFSS